MGGYGRGRSISASWKASSGGVLKTTKLGCLDQVVKSIVPQKLNARLSALLLPTPGVNSQKETWSTAALLPPNSRSRKAQRRPTNKTEAALWVQETMRYQRSADGPI